MASGESKHYGPFSVVAGTNFSAATSGSGDADLYVKFGSAPTTSSYDCRPYRNGSNETCSQSVPSGQTEAYVMVRGYTSSSYTLNVDYTKPGDGSGGGTGTGTSTGSTGPTEVTETLSGDVASNAEDNFGPYAVVPGTTVTAAMSGSGDPDLYVRFGAAPTTSSYDCRPYKSGAAESCTLTVPSNKSSVYVMVRGYSSSSYSVQLTYTKP